MKTENLIFKTLNSTYEVDFCVSKIRRLDGTDNPTPRQGTDGEWKSYESIKVPIIDEPVTIVWYTETEHKPGLIDGEPAADVFGVARTTITSPVTDVR